PSRPSSGGDAGHDGAAEIDGQRAENARLPPAVRSVRFPWVHVRSDVFTANGRGLSRRATSAQEGPRGLPSTQRVGRQTPAVHTAGSDGLPGQSGVARV